MQHVTILLARTPVDVILDLPEMEPTAQVMYSYVKLTERTDLCGVTFFHVF